MTIDSRKRKLISQQFDHFFSASRPITISDQGEISTYGGCFSHDLIFQDACPVTFDTVGGTFSILGSKRIKSLVGTPRYVGSIFNCGNASITSLVGGPKIVKGSYFCHKNIIYVIYKERLKLFQTHFPATKII